MITGFAQCLCWKLVLQEPEVQKHHLCPSGGQGLSHGPWEGLEAGWAGENFSSCCGPGSPTCPQKVSCSGFACPTHSNLVLKCAQALEASMKDFRWL